MLNKKRCFENGSQFAQAQRVFLSEYVLLPCLWFCKLPAFKLAVVAQQRCTSTDNHDKYFRPSSTHKLKNELLLSVKKALRSRLCSLGIHYSIYIVDYCDLANGGEVQILSAIPRIASAMVDRTNLQIS